MHSFTTRNEARPSVIMGSVSNHVSNQGIDASSQGIDVSSRRIAIFGCAGQLGTELTAEFGKRGYQVSGFTRSQVDITDAAQVEACLARVDPAVAINAAAYNQVDVAEKEPQAS